MLPVHKWMEKRNGKLIYSDHEPLQRELTQRQKKALERYNQSGKARFFPKEQVERTIISLRKNKDNRFKSNDIHILGLAKTAKAKILCSKDTDLHHDFKQILNGNIYQNKKHEHLLTRDACP